MHPYPDDELLSAAAPLCERRRIARQRARCTGAAKLSFLGAAAGIVFLCLRGMHPASVTVPVLLAVLSLLCVAASGALFAYVAGVYLERPGQDPGDEGGGPGGGADDEPPEPSGGGDLRVDWEQFDRDFRSFCEQVTTAIR